MNIPVPTNMFDGAICIAVLHHISTEVKAKHSFYLLLYFKFSIED